MKWMAAIGNFFFPGTGYLLAVPHKRVQGAMWLVAAIGFTYVEQVALGPGHAAFWPMFVSVFVLNTAFAWDAYVEVDQLQSAVPA